MRPAEDRSPFASRRSHEQRPAGTVRGGPAVAAWLLALAGAGGLIAAGAVDDILALKVLGPVLVAVVLFVRAGFIVVQPNDSRVLILFGRYVGTVLEPGLVWVNPFTVFWRRPVSLRVRNFQSATIKVNDASGNPIEIAAVIVWRVIDTAKATFDVESYEQFVVVQSETAIR